MAETVTVSITRSVDPDRIPEATSWVQQGVNLANRYPGFLGSGWVRAAEDAREWHMLYRFADEQQLDAWETSDERAGWLEQGRELVTEKRVQRRSGIEGWFDQPTDKTGSLQAIPAAPPRWKQAVSIWCGFFPTNLVFTLLISLAPFWDGWPIPVRVLVSTLVLTPIMTFWVLPLITRLLQPWLQRP
ncbi:MAG: antibiotic biosynthesis monooxygenase [Microbacterium sp.]